MTDFTSAKPVDEPQPAKAGPRSQALDGYRAIAIAVVLLSHAKWSTGYPAGLTPLNVFLKGGVTAFMVLSGYLITLSLLREEARAGAVDCLAFWRRQAIRFYVPVLPFLAAIGLWFFKEPGFRFERTFFVLWMDPLTAKGGWWTGHLYSLAAQLQFCVWWPLLLWVFRRGSRLVPVTVLMLAGSAWRTVGRELAAQSGGDILRTDFVFGSLLVGAWWGMLVFEGRMEWIFRLRGRQLLPMVTFAVLIILFTRSPSAALAIFSTGLRDWVAPWRETLGIVVTIRVLMDLAAMMAFGGLAFLLHRGRPARIAGLFASPLITWLGRISFSVYLWQNVFCFGVTGTVFDRFPLNLAASLGFGWVAYWLFEVPSLRWRSRLKRKPVENPTKLPDEGGVPAN